MHGIVDFMRRISAVFPKRGAAVPTVSFTMLRGAGSQCLLQYIIKILVSKCHETLKQICMGSPLGGANYIWLL